jgi:hypothetical protein
MDEKINDLWEFVQLYQDEFIYANYADYHQKGVKNIYSKLDEYIKAIDSSLDIEQTNKMIPTSINSCVELNIMVITCNGNKDKLNLVENVYKASKKYTFDKGFSIIKFMPESFVFPYIRFYDIFLDIANFQYLLNTDANGLDLIITANENVLKYIKTDEDIAELRNGCFVFLENLVGEFIMTIYMNRITVIPYTTFIEQHKPEILTNLHEYTKLKKTIQDYAHVLLPEKRCASCKISNYHIDVDDLCRHCLSICGMTQKPS